MKRRLDALTRIGRLQALMHDLGRWRLHSLEGQQAGLNDDLKAVFEILDSDEVANGVHAGLVARRIRALQLRLDQLSASLTLTALAAIKPTKSKGSRLRARCEG